jgi:predicted HAD superfamily phosphohydrolase
MRYILDVSGHDLKLIRASIVNFQRSLEMSDQADFDNIIDDLDVLFFKLSMMKKEQINNKIKRKWGNKK